MTTKMYTDINQSKKLAEILPLESSDMSYDWFVIGKEYSSIPQCRKFIDDELPCWSLAALLNVLPTTIGNFFEKNALRLRMDKGENDFNIWYDNFDYGDVAEELDVKENNPVDACVEMIKKLHEQKLYN